MMPSEVLSPGTFNTVLRMAKRDLDFARKYGYIMIRNTRIGDVQISYKHKTKTYEVIRAGDPVPVISGKYSEVAAQIVKQVYIIEFK